VAAASDLLVCSSSHYLSTLLLSDNLLTGFLPPELGLLRSLKTVNVQQNLLSCHGGHLTSSSSSSASLSAAAGHAAIMPDYQHQDDDRLCTSDVILPCFLNITQELYPRQDGSHMECPYIIRKTHDQAAQDCKGSDTTDLVRH
jgi:hypothetical protein